MRKTGPVEEAQITRIKGYLSLSDAKKQKEDES